MKKIRDNIVLLGAMIISGCVFYALSGGIRSNYGLLENAISHHSGLSYSSISLILAIAQLSFGIMQPVYGVIALNRTNAFVLSLGAIMAGIGLMGIPFCHKLSTLILFLGLLLPIGLAAFSFGIIMGAITPILGEQRAAAVSGFVSASSGIGNTILSPVLRMMLDQAGLWGAILSLSIPTFCLIPVARWLSRFINNSPGIKKNDHTLSIRAALSVALSDRSYWFIIMGFFTCGFHMAIIETHLYSEFISYGFSAELIAYAFSLYGITTILGSVISGFLCSRFAMKRVLGYLYGSRTVLIIGFMLLPKSLLTIYGYAAVLGLTGAATVPPTSGLVNKLYGTIKLGTLFGVAFVAHQIGSFFSAWLGGLCLSFTGSYSLIWCTSAVLSLVAATVSFFIKEEQKFKMGMS